MRTNLKRYSFAALAALFLVAPFVAIADQRSDVTIFASGKLTSALDTGTVEFPFTHGATYTLENGTSAGQGDLVFTDTRTLSASGTEDLDLAGALSNAVGATLTFAKIKAVIVTASSANTNAVQVTRPASNGVILFMAAGDGISLSAGQSFGWVDSSGSGKAVTASTGDLLTITNSAGSTSVTYTVTIIGTSA